MSDYSLFINGDLFKGASSQDVINPATEEVIAQASIASHTQIDLAIQSAFNARRNWAADEQKRRQALNHAAEALEKNIEELAKLITLEQGRPIAFSIGEVHGAVATLRQYAVLDTSQTNKVLRDDEQRYVKVELQPFGVVAAITPWNVPIILLVLKIAPALLLGNTVIAKPSEYTPLSTLKLAEIIGKSFPPGVFNVISGDGQIGEYLVNHPLVRKITFTGSVNTGRKILSGSAQRFQRTTLELGGNDPAIVLDDADPDSISEKLFWGAFWNTGQVCFAIKRLYVHESIYERVLSALIVRASNTVIGNGFDKTTELGPLTTKPQFERIKKLVEDARSQGATIHTGGQANEGAGYFYPPTIVSNLSAGAALIEEEQFGPVLPIIPYSNLDETLTKINANNFGLGASVWTRDADRGLAVVREIDAGLAWVNNHLDIQPNAPKGGRKWSGLGYEGGLYGYEEFGQLQTINLSRQ